MIRVLISWAHSHHLVATSTYFWQWTMSLRGLEVIPTITCVAKVVLKFLPKHIFSCFGNPMEIMSDEGTHFCNKLFDSLLSKYGVRHLIALAYHPQCNGQVEISN